MKNPTQSKKPPHPQKSAIMPQQYYSNMLVLNNGIEAVGILVWGYAISFLLFIFRFVWWRIGLFGVLLH
jgi:hypothetical protein